MSNPESILALLRLRSMSREEIQNATGLTSRSFHRAMQRLRLRHRVYTIQTGAEFVYELAN